MAVIIWAIGYNPAFYDRNYSVAKWVISNWNPKTDLAHGWMIPLLSGFMLIQAAVKHKQEAPAGNLHGLWLLMLGLVLYLISIRTVQTRIACLAFPFLLLGAVWCYWGYKAARRCAFPFFFLWLGVPMPGLHQATVGMQILSTKLAHWCIGVCGVQTIVEGTHITFASGNWDTFHIAGGCSGMRSLLALLMISCTWGYMADKLPLWKRITLGLSAIPLSVLANAFRVASIFICAEYINPAFASKTWHDWSGLLFFFPASLAGIILLHGLLTGEIPLLKRRKTVIIHRSRKEENAQ